jgi:hypothetical protein
MFRRFFGDRRDLRRILDDVIARIEKLPVAVHLQNGSVEHIEFALWRESYAESCEVCFIGRGNGLGDVILLPDDYEPLDLLKCCYYARFARCFWKMPKRVVHGPTLPSLCQIYCGVLRTFARGEIPESSWKQGMVAAIDNPFMNFAEDWAVLHLCLAVHCGDFIEPMETIAALALTFPIASLYYTLAMPRFEDLSALSNFAMFDDISTRLHEQYSPWRIPPNHFRMDFAYQRALDKAQYDKERQQRWQSWYASAIRREEQKEGARGGSED